MADLWERLESAGFKIAREHYNGGMYDDWAADLARGLTEIRFLRDRGQWAVTVGRGREFCPPDVWRAYLGDIVDPLAERTLDEDCETVVMRLDEIDSALANDPDVFERLKTCGTRLFRARHPDIKWEGD
jgi:hypothetical protein